MRSPLLAVGILSLCLSAINGFADPPNQSGDWPQFRGPSRDAICAETGLLKEWPNSGPTLLWDSNEVNGGPSVETGIASLAIVRGRIYTMGDHFGGGDGGAKKKPANKGGDGFLFCVDAVTGKEIWKKKIGPSYSNPNGSGPRCTPSIDGDRLYALAPDGQLLCAKTEDCTIIWRKNLIKDFGGKMMSSWGYSESPIIDGDRLICTPGGKAAAVVALDKMTGELVWKCELPTPCGAGYATIAITEAAGVKQYITVMGKELGLIGVDASSGKFLWNYAKVANGTANCPTALVKDDYVFASTGYSAGAALLKLVPDGPSGIKAEEVYFLSGAKLQNHHGGMVMLGDYIYGGHGHTDGRPFCLEWKTGKFAWGPVRNPARGSAAVLFADGHLYFRYEDGTMALIEATPERFKLKASFELPPIAAKGWPHPVIYQGRLYLRGDEHILCYDIKN